MGSWLQIILLIILTALPVGAVEPPVDASPLDLETGARIEALLGSQGEAVLGAGRVLAHEQLLPLYRKRGFRPVWLSDAELKPEVPILIEALRNAGVHGLCWDDYLLPEIEGLLRIQEDFARHGLSLAADNLAVLDLYLSEAFFTYATHMIEGQVDPSLAHVDWKARRRKADLVRLLEYVVKERRLPQVLADLLPPHPEYLRLVAALADYRRIAALGGWPQLPAGPTLRPGERDERVLLLREILLRTGDLAAEMDPEPVYDAATAGALRAFQARHGLETDGAVGRKTLAALNVPVEERIRQIELNLERWRWMPKSFGKRHIRVNVADFSLAVIEDGRPVLEMSVIVGTQYRKTPVFSAQMSYLEFAPYWTVPPTILREDKLPAIKANPAYLEEKHFNVISRQDGETVIDPATIDWQAVRAETFPGLLRMDPGPWNPLGRVKFMFPNQFNIYLHDTNEAHLFDKNVRPFSSGCIRIENPRALAGYLLDKTLDPGRLDLLFNATVPEKVDIQPLPVHIQYWTAWVDEDGRANFRPDVYYRDLDLDVALTVPAYRVLDQLKVSSGTRLAGVK